VAGVQALARRFNLKVIEDAAHCCPSYYREDGGRRTEGGKAGMGNQSQSSVLSHPSSVIRPQSSVLSHPSSVFRQQSSVLSPQSSVVRQQSSVFGPLASRRLVRRHHLLFVLRQQVHHHGGGRNGLHAAR
jgi:hypothetical protein